MFRKLLLSLSLFAALSVSAQTTTTMTFDGFDHPTDMNANTTYRGLLIGNSFHEVVSGTNTYLATSLSNGSTIVRQVSGSSFFLNSIDVWSRRGADANGAMYLVLYNGSTTVYNSLAVPNGSSGRTREVPIRFTATPATVDVTSLYGGSITAFAFAFKTNPAGAGDWDHFGTDNWVLRTSDEAVLAPVPSPVPEPSSMALMLAGLGFVAARKFRKVS